MITSILGQVTYPITAVVVLLLLIGLLVLSSAIFVLMRKKNHQALAAEEHEIIEPSRLGADGLGECATLLQFSYRSCERSAQTHWLLAEIAKQNPGVRHLNIDLTSRPDIARHFHVVQTPTTLILDSDGAVQSRLGGPASPELVKLEVQRLAIPLS